MRRRQLAQFPLLFTNEISFQLFRRREFPRLERELPVPMPAASCQDPGPTELEFAPTLHLQRLKSHGCAASSLTIHPQHNCTG